MKLSRETIHEIRHQFMPWSGLIAGFIGAAAVHQIGSEGQFNDCGQVDAPVIWLVGLVGLALVAAGAFGSWRVFHKKGEGESRRLISGVSLGMAALFAMTIALPMVASLMIPRCYM
jgi:hypothetical protein